MDLPNDLSPTVPDLIDWMNGEGLLDLDWDFPEDGDLYEAGLDANSLVELAAAIEDEYDVDLSPQEFKKHKVKTPIQLARVISERRN